MTALGKAQLGATTFFATSFPSDLCGANGLPLTPSSIKILGRFKELTSFIHPHLCRYIDLVRGKHERVVVVQEYYSNNLSLARKTGKYTKSGELFQLAYEILDGLDYLHQEAVTHRCLCPGYIQFDEKGKVKISCYGMYRMTGSGEDVPFPIGLPRYTAPEVYTEEHHQPHQIIKRRHGDGDEDQAATALSYPASGPKVDIWSLGILLLECYLDVVLWNGLTPKHVAQKLLKLFTAERHPLDIILEDHKIKLPEDVPSDVEKLLRLCLHISPLKRPSAETLLDMEIFAKQRETQSAPKNGFYIFTTELRCKDLEVVEYQGRQDKDEEEDHLAARDIMEVYYLWKLAGGDIIATLKKCGLVRSQPPVTTLSSFVVEEGEMFGTDRDRSTLLDETVVTLSQEQLRERLANVDEATYYPLLEAEKEEQSTKQNGDSYQNQAVDLPLVIKERDVEYQFHRVVLFDRLLKAYPYKRPDILREARVDIPPHFRAHVWAALLEVEGDVQGRYRSIDKETPTPTDRQIAVDIPRCHQYDELLSSPTAHAKFKRILKAWVVSHPQYVYWQGLDSLCAPFLYLNFNDEALAYACLSAFIPKYLHKFFLKDNSPVIQEYLAVFSHLITFHDPELGNHLDGIGFIPDLYAIPWFLTMYAHVFPLHKILHLWDTMLLGNSSFPLCIGVAILRQLKDPLLSFGFNECILLFSDMPEIDIGRCVQDSIKIFCSTPKSATFRQHARPQKQTPNIETRPNKPNVSYYSQDYNDRAHSELSMEPIPLEELKVEKCPRISAEDLIDLCELAGHSPTRSPSKRTQNSKPKILVIDVRSQEEYMRGTIPGSINIPFSSAFSPEGDLIPCPAVQDLNAHKAQIKVVMGSRGRNAVHFAHELVRFGYSKVCILHKGIDGLRATGLLAVPSPDIL